MSPKFGREPSHWSVTNYHFYTITFPEMSLSGSKPILLKLQNMSEHKPNQPRDNSKIYNVFEKSKVGKKHLTNQLSIGTLNGLLTNLLDGLV